MISEKREKSAGGRSGRLRNLNRALTAVQTVAAVIFGARLAALNLLPAGYMAAYSIAVLMAGVLFWITADRKGAALAAAAASVLITGGLLYALGTVNRLDDTLQKVSTAAGQETVEMAVAVPAGSTMETLADISGGRTGYIRNGEGVEAVKAVLEETLLSPPEYEEYDDVVSLADALLTGEAAAILVNSEFIRILSGEETYEGFSDKVRVLYTIEVNGAENPEGKPRTGDQEGEEDPGGNGSSGDKTAFVVYISGIDTFGSINVKSRSDVNILMAVNRESGCVQLVSTPRDSYLQLPGRGMDKLTHAGLYGADCSREVLETLYGIPIDYYVRVNFSGFEEIIDLMGGIDVYSEYDFTVEPVKHYTVGYNHLSGIEALAFARERHAFAEGDVQRGTNQMEVIRGVIAGAASADLITGGGEMLGKIGECVQTDIPPEVIYSLMRQQLSGGTEWQVESFTVRGTDSREVTYSIPGAALYVLLPDAEDVAEAKGLLEAVLEGDTDT